MRVRQGQPQKAGVGDVPPVLGTFEGIIPADFVETDSQLKNMSEAPSSKFSTPLEIWA